VDYLKVGVRIILKFTLRTYAKKLCTGFIWLQIYTQNESSVPGKQWQFVDQLSDSQLLNTNWCSRRFFHYLVTQFMLQSVPSIVSPSTAVLFRQKPTSAEIWSVRRQNGHSAVGS
jgi:hypothetical protein